MENTVKERLITFIKCLNMTQKAFEERCNMSNGYVANIRKGIGSDKLLNIAQEFPELNREWLLYGEGEMLKQSQPSVTQNNYNGNNNYVVGNGNSVQCSECGAAVPAIECEEVQAAPVIPSALAVRPNIDVIEELEKREGAVELSSVRTDMPIDCWYRVIDDSLYPEYKIGDKLALLAYPKGKEKPIPGEVYVVQMESNGMVPRILFPEGRDFRAHAINSERYPDFIIERDDVVWVFRILFAVRMRS